MVLKPWKKIKYSPKRKGAFNRLREDNAPGTYLVTEHYAENTVLSKGHLHKAFQIVGLSFKSCVMELQRQGRVDSEVQGHVISVQTQM